MSTQYASCQQIFDEIVKKCRQVPATCLRSSINYVGLPCAVSNTAQIEIGNRMFAGRVAGSQLRLSDVDRIECDVAKKGAPVELECDLSIRGRPRKQ